MMVVARVRKCTIKSVVDAIEGEERERIMTAIAALVFDGRIFSDLCTNALSLATELSAFHAFA
jgi:hypothetical protein